MLSQYAYLGDASPAVRAFALQALGQYSIYVYMEWKVKIIELIGYMKAYVSEPRSAIRKAFCC